MQPSKKAIEIIDKFETSANSLDTQSISFIINNSQMNSMVETPNIQSSKEKENQGDSNNRNDDDLEESSREKEESPIKKHPAGAYLRQLSQRES